MITRRSLLGGAVASLTAIAAAPGLAGCGLVGDKEDAPGSEPGTQLTSAAALPKPFTARLPIPPVKKPARTAGGVDYYDLTAQESEVEILPGLKTKIMGYDGIFPGPTIAARRGRPVVIRYRNKLGLPTVVHLHGGHVPAESDGFPTDLVLPATGGASFAAQAVGGRTSTGAQDYRYPMTQRAATLWYHDHRMGFTGPQIWRGLAGLFLVGDDEEAALPLPRGARDIPLMIMDRAFDADGAFSYPATDRSLASMPGVQEKYMNGVTGDVILVNGAAWPALEVDAARYRLRILNASNARAYELALDSGAVFTQIGSDQGLLAAPVTHDTLAIAPAERFDVVVDFSQYPVGTQVTLTNKAGKDGTAQVMRFTVARKVTDDSSVPAALSTMAILPTGGSTKRRDWMFKKGKVTGMGMEMDGWVINNKEFDPRRDDADPRLGEVEIWRIGSDAYHPVHIHHSAFQVISRDGGAPAATDAGWKDTVSISPKQVVEVAVRFTDYKGRFLVHCHNLEHEDMAMMSAFRVA